MVAPKAPGHRVREVFKEGAGVPGPDGDSRRCDRHRARRDAGLRARRSAAPAPASSRRPSRKRRKPISSASRRCCAAASARWSRAGFETLVEAGYQPEIAYFECLHELKLIVDLMYRGGLGFMRYSVSDTAEHGDYTGGPRIVTAETKEVMRKMLAEIRSGAYAEKLAQQTKSGWFQAERERQREHQIEQVGAKLRARMPFLEPVASPEPEPVAG